jgi:hypothetical protein
MLLNVVADDDLSPDNAVGYTSAGSAIVARETLSGVLGNAGAIASRLAAQLIPALSEFEDAPNPASDAIRL